MPTLPQPLVDVIEKIIVSLAILLVSILATRLARSLVHRSSHDSAQGHTLNMLVRNSILFLAGGSILLVWLGYGSDLAVVMGVLGAGIAFASQEVIGSFAGFLNIVSGRLFRIGDRVKLGNVVGDVIDISILRTSVMEIGDWVRADQYTGRIVSIANRVVFSDPLYNYTKDWEYLWDEITIPITYDSEWKYAGDLMIEHASQYVAGFVQDAHEGLDRLLEQYPLQPLSVAPSTYVVMTDNWVELTLRYIVQARKRREIKDQLHRELLMHFQAEDRIKVASATFELVAMPPLEGQVRVAQAEYHPRANKAGSDGYHVPRSSDPPA